MMSRPELEGSEIMVPGSIANLGPGLDTLAVAVQIYLRVRVASVSPSRLIMVSRPQSVNQ